MARIGTLTPSNERVGMSQSERIQPWVAESSERIADCRIFSVDRVRRRQGQSGEMGEFFTIRSRDWVNVVAVTEQQQLVLIRQFRHAAEEVTLEVPGGIVDAGESPLQAGGRELLEETGYTPGELQLIGRVRSNPAIIDNWTYTVLATGCVASGEIAPDEHEQIEVVLRPAASADELIRSGQITHALVINALTWYRLHRDHHDRL